MSPSRGLYRGQPLESFSSDALIDIIMEMDRQHKADAETHSRERDIYFTIQKPETPYSKWRGLIMILIGMALGRALYVLFFLVK